MTPLSALKQLELQSDTRKKAAADERIRGAPFTVIVRLSETLDDQRFQQVGVASLARSVNLHDVTTAQALQRLVRCGYLERGPREDRMWTYRLKHQPTEKAG